MHDRTERMHMNWFACSFAFALAASAASAATTAIAFTENTEPFVNPAQGWTAYWNWDKVTNHCNVGCGYARYQWRHFNPQEGVYKWDVLEREIGFYAKKGLPFYFRIMTCSRNGGRKSIVPDWVWEKGAKYKPYPGSRYNWGEGGTNQNATTEMWCPVWNDRIFLEEHAKFIRALAEKYDGDPRLYAIDIGSYGNWGEWHCWRLGKDGVSDRDYGADYETKWRIMRMYIDVFKKTPLIAMTDDVPTLVRLFKGGKNPPAGLRRDGVGMPKLFNRWGKSGWKYDAVDGMDDVWKSKPIAFEWLQPLSRLMKPGDRAFEKGQKMDDIGYAVKWMLDRHVSTIDTVPFYPWQLDDYPEKKKDTRLLDLYAGARLVPVSADVERVGERVSVTLNGINKGVAPIYAPYRLSLCVKSAGWQRDFDADLLKCLPGPFTFKGVFDGVPRGALSLRIRHEHGVWRDFRFAAKELDGDGSLLLGAQDAGSVPGKKENAVGLFDRAHLRGACDRTPAFYAPGETMTFTLRLEHVGGPVPAGTAFVVWKRTGDDSLAEEGRVDAATLPLVVRTSLGKPGFVRLFATLQDAKGRIFRRAEKIDGRTVDGVRAANPYEKNDRRVFFDGGAGVEPEKIAQFPEPEDFDAFWAKRRAALAAVPMTAERKLVDGVGGPANIYAVSVTCAGPRPVTGYLSVPKWAEGKKKACGALVRFDGYSRSSVQRPTKVGGKGLMIFHINAHGYELGREYGYYKKFYKSIESNGHGYAFDPAQNSNPDTAYFGGMTWRVMRALEYVKSLPEWNGRLSVTGGSQGGLQCIWAAGLDRDVTEVDARIPWGCDHGGETMGRNRGGWFIPFAKGLPYYDAVNHAKRVNPSCRVNISRAGLGDYTCPPSGIAMMFESLPCASKRIFWVQGSTHGFAPAEPNQVFSVKKGIWKK